MKLQSEGWLPIQRIPRFGSLPPFMGKTPRPPLSAKYTHHKVQEKWSHSGFGKGPVPLLSGSSMPPQPKPCVRAAPGLCAKRANPSAAHFVRHLPAARGRQVATRGEAPHSRSLAPRRMAVGGGVFCWRQPGFSLIFSGPHVVGMVPGVGLQCLCASWFAGDARKVGSGLQ